MTSSLSKLHDRLRSVYAPGLLHLAARLQKLAAPSSSDYLTSLNFQTLKKKTPKPQEADTREFYQEMQEAAKHGPIFSERVLSVIDALANALTKPEALGLGKWLEGVLRKNPDTGLENISLITAWSVANHKTLAHESYQQALASASDWLRDPEKANAGPGPTGKFNTKKVIFDCSNGYTVVDVDNAEDLYQEGEIMQNCLAEDKHGTSYWDEMEEGNLVIYSLRDKGNNPHVSMEFVPARNGVEAEQIFGKQNAAPDPFYAPYLGEFLAGFKHEWNTISLPYANEEALTTLSTSRDYDLRKEVAANRNTPLAVLMSMTEDEDEEVREHLALAARFPKLLSKLSKDSSYGVRVEVARNHHAAPVVLDLLSKDKEEEVRLKVARNPYTSVDTLRFLIGDEFAGVRGAVALSGKIVPKDLETLSTDAHYLVRQLVCKNNHTAAETLAAMIEAGEPNPEVRRAIIASPNVSKETLQAIFSNEKEDAGIRDVARLKLTESKNASISKRLNLLAFSLRS